MFCYIIANSVNSRTRLIQEVLGQDSSVGKIIGRSTDPGGDSLLDAPGEVGYIKVPIYLGKDRLPHLMSKYSPFQNTYVRKIQNLFKVQKDHETQKYEG